ncbi:uncharacterized protein LOC111015239 [Momordica charantia]|uniref:Uncharacterized protein LOC111015239 n=1 Tax=Momordica charantia TaxID=3673 RepID=A0A6J1CXR2_MOMCH|nr:uncharacterized protein LOC111015239 [Momordica charantia]
MADQEITSSVPTSSTAGTTTIESQLNPYLIHHSTAPTTMLVTQQLLGASNYNSWCRSMLIALSGKNKVGFIDGTIKKPNGNLLAAWKCNNDIITSWIINSVSKEIAASIIYTGSAKDIWDELKERFQQSDAPRIFQLRKELVTTIQGTLSIEAYYTKLKTVWQELTDYRPTIDCTCSGLKSLSEFFQSEYVMTFLMGLNESYAKIRAQILLMDPIPPMNKVFSLLIQEERQRAIGTINPPLPSMAMAVAEISKRNSATQFRRKDNRSFCTHCGLRGHVIDKCYKLHGYPPGYRANNPAARIGQLHNPNGTSHSNGVVANQVSEKNVDITSSPAIQRPSNSSPAFFNSLNSSQYSQLMEMLQSHLQAAKPETITPMNHVAGQVTIENDWQG